MKSFAWRGLALLACSCSIVASGTARAEAPPAFTPPTGTITLHDAVAAALAHSPRLAVFGWQQRVSEALVSQAGLLPNPQVRAEVENFGGGGDRLAFEQTETTLSLSQLIQLGGKRAKRLRVAALDRDLTSWDYEVARLDVLTEVAKAFIANLAAQRRAQLFNDLASLARLSAETVAAQIRAGATSSTELLRAQADVGRTEAQRRQAEQQLAIARLHLAAQWGVPRPTFTEVAGDLDTVAPPPSLPTLLGSIGENPDVSRWGIELEQRRARLALERSQAIPDVTVELGGRHFSDNGDNALVGGFSLPLPLFDRNQGNILAAERSVSQADAERLRATLAVQESLATAWEELRSAFAQVTLLRDEVLPNSEAAFRSIRDAYQRGLFRFLDVLDAQRTLFEVRDQYLGTLSDYHTAVAEVERLSGVPLAAPTQGEIR